MRAREVTLVAGREMKESLRSRWFLLAAGGFFVLSLALSWLGLAGAERSGVAGFDRTTFPREFNPAVVAFFSAKLPPR